MARKSLDSRLDRLMDTLLPPGSMAAREYYLPSHLQEALRIHRTKVDSIIRGLENERPGASYEALLSNTLDVPEMPATLRTALGLVDPPVVTEDMTVSEAAALWAEYALGTSQ